MEGFFVLAQNNMLHLYLMVKIVPVIKKTQEQCMQTNPPTFSDDMRYNKTKTNGWSLNAVAMYIRIAMYTLVTLTTVYKQES